MEKNLEREKARFASACHALYKKGLVCGVGGNLCARAGNFFLLTPTGCSLREIQPGELSVLDSEENVVQGPQPTKDKSIHMEILRRRKDINVSCHVHGANIIAASCLLKPGPHSLPPLTPGFVYFAYPLPMLPFLVPGSKPLQSEAVKMLTQYNRRALLLQNHGLITLGKNYDEAIDIAEEVEEAAHIYLLTRGKGRQLTDEEIESIKKL